MAKPATSYETANPKPSKRHATNRGESILPERVTHHANRLTDQLQAHLHRLEEPDLREAALHYPQAGGKALRPALAALSYEALGGDDHQADPLAVSVELLHTFSLVHDDLMDQDETRRGVDAVHRAWDTPTAILAGDGLFALAFEVLGELDQHPRAMTVVTHIAETARHLCEGQRLDMKFETTWPGVDTYEAMISKKTAALFAAATGNAARLASDDPADATRMHSFGHALGMGFQIQDDVLDLAGDPDALGKPLGSDVRGGKKTHPILEAHERSGTTQRDRLETILATDPTQEDVDWVLSHVEDTGALRASKMRAEAFFHEAEALLEPLAESPAVEAVEQLLAWVQDREY